jgi:hypothetical protein
MEALTAIVWICVITFAVTAIITFVALVGGIKLGGGSRELHEKYLRSLFNALIIEIVTVSIGAFSKQLIATSRTPNPQPDLRTQSPGQGEVVSGNNFPEVSVQSPKTTTLKDPAKPSDIPKTSQQDNSQPLDELNGAIYVDDDPSWLSKFSGKDGLDGGSGLAGNPGQPGADGLYGTDVDNNGSDGERGMPGNPGIAGGHGSNGRDATITISELFSNNTQIAKIEVQCPELGNPVLYYRFSHPISFSFSGGKGGDGGNGGTGGDGGKGGRYGRDHGVRGYAGNGGNGGFGGYGGVGGNGGNGGHVKVILKGTNNFITKVRELITFSVDGGAAGIGGYTGIGGVGGKAGDTSSTASNGDDNSKLFHGRVSSGLQGAAGILSISP